MFALNHPVVRVGAGFVCMAGLAGYIVVNLVWALLTGKEWFDYRSFLISGQAASRGLNPYAAHHSVFSPMYGGTVYPSPNLNPPITLYLFRAAGNFNLAIGHRVWQVATVCLVVLSVGALAAGLPRSPQRMKFTYAACMAGLWDTVQLGQIYAPLLLATCGAWVLLERRRFDGAGVLIGALVAVKPTFILWPLLLFAGGYRRTAVVAGGTAASISAIPLVTSGPTIYLQWLQASVGYRGEILPGNNSLIATAARFQIAPVGAALAILLAAILLFVVLHYRPDALLVSGLALAGAILLGPISWVGYTILLLPVVWTLAWSLPVWVATTMLVVPFWLIVPLAARSPHGFAVAGSFYVIPVLILTCVLARRISVLGRSLQPDYTDSRSSLAEIAG